MDLCKTILIYFLYLTQNKKEIPMNAEKTIIIDNSLQPNITKDIPKARSARMLLYNFARKAEKDRRMSKDRKHVKNKIPALGSRKKVRSNGNYGFFSAVVESYNTHAILDMRPDDWFFTFVQKLALAIDRQKKSGSSL